MDGLPFGWFVAMVTFTVLLVQLSAGLLLLVLVWRAARLLADHDAFAAKWERATSLLRGAANPDTGTVWLLVSNLVGSMNIDGTLSLR